MTTLAFTDRQWQHWHLLADSDNTGIYWQTVTTLSFIDRQWQHCHLLTLLRWQMTVPASALLTLVITTSTLMVVTINTSALSTLASSHSELLDNSDSQCQNFESNGSCFQSTSWHMSSRHWQSLQVTGLTTPFFEQARNIRHFVGFQVRVKN